MEENKVKPEAPKEPKPTKGKVVHLERMGDVVKKPIEELQAHLDVGWKEVK